MCCFSLLNVQEWREPWPIFFCSWIINELRYAIKPKKRALHKWSFWPFSRAWVIGWTLSLMVVVLNVSQGWPWLEVMPIPKSKPKNNKEKQEEIGIVSYLWESQVHNSYDFFVKKICWPKNGPICAKKGPKWGFRSFFRSKCVSFWRFCIIWLKIMIPIT